jgi:phage terminase Nu1 subunit (DNA packaging protein)
MQCFRSKYGQLTVEQARELNEAARWYCEHEVTSEAGDDTSN